MADSVPKDRLQPALLDRLTDDEPDRALEPRAERLISRQHMRQSVLRDLGWLFNATRAADADDWPGAPLALRSVVNFGLPALAGETASTLDVIQLERAMRQAILEFEPRIDPGSLKLRALAEQLRVSATGRYTGRAELPLCYHEGKAEWVRRRAEREGLSMDECHVYTDNGMDRPLLEMATHPNAVNPDGLLLPLAKERGWPVHAWSTLADPDRSRTGSFGPLRADAK